jgi:hypothetical protein
MATQRKVTDETDSESEVAMKPLICGPQKKRRILQLRHRCCCTILQIASKVGVSWSMVWRVVHNSSLESLAAQRALRFRAG